MRKSIIRRSVWSIAAIFAAILVDAEIMSVDERAQKLEMGHHLLDNTVRPIEDDLLAKAPDPFQADLGNTEVETPREVVTLTGDDLLAQLSKYINPTGIFSFGGEYYLVFKEKKVKVGSSIGVTYDGTEYNVVVTDITGSTYTVGLGKTELQLKLK